MHMPTDTCGLFLCFYIVYRASEVIPMLTGTEFPHIIHLHISSSSLISQTVYLLIYEISLTRTTPLFVLSPLSLMSASLFAKCGLGKCTLHGPNQS